MATPSGSAHYVIRDDKKRMIHIVQPVVSLGLDDPTSEAEVRILQGYLDNRAYDVQAAPIIAVAFQTLATIGGR